MRTNRRWSIEEKNKLVESYLAGMRRVEIFNEYEITRSVFQCWVKQYREHGTTIDGRGKHQNHVGGRPKTLSTLNPDEMTLEELREYVRMIEDIKKETAFLRKQSKNTK